ncbi:MAG: DUF2178 domain-containing protein [Candidatus Pacebacteria bacterium]|nr:DUF2178 domain-containing protein [Candidatus Paceibacterota bacterium]
MTAKSYRNIKLVIVIILSIIFSQSLIYQNFFLSIGVLIIGSLVIASMGKRVKEVIQDERDFEVGGRAALQAIQIYSWIGVIVMFILKSQAVTNPKYDPIATTIAFSVCILMLLYGFIFRIRSKGKLFDGYVIFSLVVLLFFIIMGFLGILKF